jgi:hypothetical protein
LEGRVLLLLEDNELKEYVDDVVHSLTYLVDLTFHKKKEMKAKRVLLDSTKDRLIPHITEKETAKNMYDALFGLYQNKNNGRMFHLKH